MLDAGGAVEVLPLPAVLVRMPVDLVPPRGTLSKGDGLVDDNWGRKRRYPENYLGLH